MSVFVESDRKTARADFGSQNTLNSAAGVMFPEPQQEGEETEADEANGNGSNASGQIELPINRQPGEFIFHMERDAPPCPECGAIMVRNGACYLCRGCGTTSGCS